MPLEALSDGTRLHVVITGEGVPTLVPCVGSSYPYEVSFGDELKKDFQFIFVEARGSSRSDGKPEDVASLDRISDDLEDLRQRLRLDKVIALGQSRNGMMAAHYAQKYPDSVLRTVTIGTPATLEYIWYTNHPLVTGYWDTFADENRKRIRAESEATAEREGITGRTSPEAFIRMYDLSAYHYWYDPTTTMNHWWDASLLERTLEVILASNEGWAQFNTAAAVRDSGVPAFLAFGKYDFTVPPLLELFENLPNARLEVFEKSGHFPYCEEEQEFARRNRDWVDSLEQIHD